MILILKIAIGMLVGYVLIENRHSILRLAGGFAVLTLVLAIGAFVLALFWYVGSDTIGAVGDYQSAGVIGQKVLFGIGFVLFFLLAASMLAGLWTLGALLVPRAFVRFCDRFKKPQIPIALLILVIAVTAFFAGNRIELPPPFAGWEAAWTRYGLSHGMGYDGGSTFDLLMWQAIWGVNYLLFKLRGSNPFEDTRLHSPQQGVSQKP